MKLSLLTIVCAFTLSSYSQAPTIQWQKAFGGSNHEYSKKIEQTNDGGLIIAGTSESNDYNVVFNHGGKDYWVVKTNANGSYNWMKTYGGSGDDDLTSISKTHDGGYILCGTSNSNDGNKSVSYGNTDMWIVKINSLGNIQWEKSYGGSLGDGANSIEQTADHGYIIAGITSSNDGQITNNHGVADYWVIKTDSTGNIAWQKTYGGNSYDRALSVKQTIDGGYIIAGNSASSNGDITFNHGSGDYWVLKINSTGNIIWQKSFGGSLAEIPKTISQTSDHGYIIGGVSKSTDGDLSYNYGDYDYYIVKLDSNSNVEWQKTYGGTNWDTFYDIKQTSDNGYIMVGSTSSNDGDLPTTHTSSDIWVVKLDAVGTINWQKSITGNVYTPIGSIIPTNDGGYAICGNTASYSDDVISINGSADYWIIKLAPLSATSVQENQLNNKTFSSYPNPANDILHINTSTSIVNESYAIINTLGQTVLNGKLENERSTIDVQTLQAGIYFLQIGSKQTQSYKIIKN
jgi:hypothetical protein